MKNKVILTVAVLLGLVIMAKVLLPGQQVEAPEGYDDLASTIEGLLGDLAGAESVEGDDELVIEPFDVEPEDEGLGDVY